MPETTTVGRDYAQALAAKDWDAIAALLDPQIDFRALTPRRTWEASDPDGVISGVLKHWFEDADEVQSLERLEHDSFADRERVGYRLRVRNPEGDFLVEQQAYMSSSDGRVNWMRVLCSGYRPLES
jgi:hypothetical protein